VKRYWDSSAIVDALEVSRIEALAMEREQFTRLHSLAEVFSTITGGRLGYRYGPADAAALIAEITSKMTLVELTRQEVQTALEEAERLGVRGGQVHDLLHAVAARKARVEVLLTYNLGDFANLATGFKVEAP
jgi:hypothetical protein